MGHQTECSDWSGERSVLIGGEPTNVFKRSVLARGDAGLPAIGRAPTNQDAEFLAAVKRSLSIGRGNGAFSLVGNRAIKTL